MMVANEIQRVWLVPQKFWSATEEMSAEEVEKLIEHLMFLSAERDFDSLQKFDFIRVDSGRLRNAA
jgi:hypothetical protein